MNQLITIAHLTGMPHIHLHDAIAALVILFLLGMAALAMGKKGN